MVIKVDVTGEVLRRKDRLNKLEEIAKQVLPNCVISHIEDDSIRIEVEGHDPILVSIMIRNYIKVKHPELENYAMNLARAYEASGEKEFTVETDYSSQPKTAQTGPN